MYKQGFPCFISPYLRGCVLTVESSELLLGAALSGPLVDVMESVSEVFLIGASVELGLPLLSAFGGNLRPGVTGVFQYRVLVICRVLTAIGSRSSTLHIC